MRSVLPLNFPENWQRGTWVNILHHPLIGCEALWLIVISCIKSLECRAWVHCKTVFWLPLTLELCLGLFHILQRKGCGKMRCCCFSDQLGQPSASPSGGFSSGGCVLTTAQQVSTAGTFAEGHQILSSANGPDSGRKMLPLLQQHDMIQPSITLFKWVSHAGTKEGLLWMWVSFPLVCLQDVLPSIEDIVPEFGPPLVKAIPGAVGLASDPEPVHTRHTAGAVSPACAGVPLGQHLSGRHALLAVIFPKATG